MRQDFTHTAFGALAAILLIVPNLTQAAPIDESDFIGSDSITTFNDIQLGDRNTPISFDGNEFRTNDGVLRVGNFDFLGTPTFSLDAVSTNTQIGYLDVIFNEPVARVGGRIGVDSIWRASATFFDPDGQALNSQTLQVEEDMAFVGFEDTSTGISRVRFDDLRVLFDVDNDGEDELILNNNTLILDDLRFGGSVASVTTVPTSSTWLLMISGLMAVGAAASRTR